MCAEGLSRGGVEAEVGRNRIRAEVRKESEGVRCRVGRERREGSGVHTDFSYSCPD